MFRRFRDFLETRGSHRSKAVPEPSQRPWVHPSELPGSFDYAVMPVSPRASSRRFQGTVATLASGLLVAGTLLLAAPISTPIAGATTGPHEATSVAGLPKPARTAADGLLALVILQSSHISTATAMVVAPGDVAVTTTQIPANSSIQVLREGSQSAITATPIGSDDEMGVTVLRLNETLPITPIDELRPAVETGGAPTSLTALAAVRGSVSKVVFEYATAVLSATESSRRVGNSIIAVTPGQSAVGSVAGGIVLDGSGAAVAIGVPALGEGAYVSTTFMSLLAQRVVLGDANGHGWLQIKGVSLPGGGVRIVSVPKGSTSSSALLAGEEILALNGTTIGSMEDLGSALYTASPGQLVTVTVARDSKVSNPDVTLAASP